ncbi:MAG: LytR C-terminal domain-containing protein [Thermoleophilia bacterium]
MSTGSSGGGANQWARPVLLAVSCIVIGFVIGWFARGDGGGVVLPTVADAVETTATVASVDTTGTSTTFDTTGTTATTGTTGTTGGTVTGAPARNQINLVILNGTETAGLAGKTQTQAESIGYTTVGISDAPETQATTVAYYRTGEQAAAQQVAADLGAQTEEALTDGSPIESAAVTVQPDVDVVLVLGG